MGTEGKQDLEKVGPTSPEGAAPPEPVEHSDRRQTVEVVSRALVAALKSVEVSFPYREGLWRRVYETALSASISALRVPTQKEMRRYCPEGIDFEKNPHRRPFREVLKDGIERFRQNSPNTPVRWQENEMPVSVNRLAEIFNSEVTPEDIDTQSSGSTIPSGYKGKPVCSLLVNHPEATAALRGIITRRLPRDSADIIGDAECGYVAVTGEEFERIFALHARTIESLGQEIPISASHVLAVCLEENSGDLNKAIRDMTLVLKYSARGDYESYMEVLPEQPEQVKRFRDIILDEYSDFVPYQRLELPAPPDERAGGWDRRYRGSKLARALGYESSQQTWDHQYYKTLGLEDREPYMDYSLYNRTGLPYHAAHIASLLGNFSPEVITVMVAGEYAEHGPEHGKCKLLADLRVLRDLYKIRDLLREYAR